MVNRKRVRVLFLLVLTVLIYALWVTTFKTPKTSKFPVSSKLPASSEPNKVADSKINSNTEPLVQVPEKETEESTSPVALDISKFDNLKIRLEDMSKNNGLWSIYVKDLKSGQYLSINNKKMVAASLIKLDIMAKTYQAIQLGAIENNKEVSELLKKMITISDNEASNKLVEILGQGSHKNGMAVVNKFAISIDCMDTEQQRDMKDSRPIPVKGENYTSVEDCAKLLEKIYNNRCISPELDKDMMNLLLAQERNTKLPALIPKGIKIAHKTGELSQTENDVGIVFAPKTDYIICVMSNEVKNTNDARKLISQMSKVVYDFFEK